MAKAYSSDLRERVIGAVDEGATRREAAERFDVSVSSAVRWFQAWRSDGSFAAKPRGGSRSPLEGHAEEILALIDEQPDWTLEELVVALHKRRIPGSRSALARFLVRREITFKKKPASSRAGARGCGSVAPTLDAQSRAS
jgi:transposase